MQSKKTRKEVVKKLTENYLSYRMENDDDLNSQFHRLADYCVDNTSNGYAFPEWLTEEEKMWIIYEIMSKCKYYLYNKKGE